MPRSRSAAARALGASALAVIALTTAAPAPAHAQLGGLLKKAKKAVASPGSGRRPSGPPPRFTATMLELDANRLAHVIDGLTAEQHLLESAAWRQHYSTAVHRRDATQEALSASFDTHDKQATAYEEASRRNHDCRDSVSYELTRRHEHEDEGATANDSAAMAAIQTKLMAAAARGDMAAIKKIQQEAMAMGKPMQQRELATAAHRAAADSAALDKACGQVPVEPPFIAEQDSLRTGLAQLNDTVRVIEAQVPETGVKTSGLTNRQFAMAVERIRLYLHGGSSFSQAELEALRGKETVLKDLLEYLDRPIKAL